MNIKKLLCLVLALTVCLGALALAEGDDLQAKLDEANARIEALEAEVELYKPFYEKQIVAEYGEGGVIWRDDAMEQYESAASMYSQYGMNIDDYAAEIKQDILETMVRDAVQKAKAAELGVDQIDDDTRAGLEAEAAATFENYVTNYVEYYRESFESQGVSEEEARKQITENLEQSGMSLDTLVQQMVDSYVSEQLHAKVTEGVEVSDEEVRQKYDAMVDSDSQRYTDDRTFNNARNNGATIAWNPEGYRAVKNVLIKFDDDQTARYNELQSTLDSLDDELKALDAPAEDAADATADAEAEPTEAPRSREEIQADIGRVGAEKEALYSELLPQAQQVIDAFEQGTDFDSLIEKYNADPGMQREPAATNGYAVAESSTTWDPAFTEGAMSIEAVGQISAPVYGVNGIHIIYYLSDIPAGAVPFEDIAEAVKSAALDDKVNATFNDQVDAWIEAAAPVYHIDRF